ncbi:MAG TPA: TraM recognition domain-containing protein [Stellaceae bacterium]|nr:TraM recognition domain-containing protein [Stellaceae bacterium]
MRNHFPRWPTGSPDPLVNIIATGILVILGFLALATSLLILVPIAIGFTVIALMRWHHNRPPSYANPALSTAVALRTIEANFPDGDAFIKFYLHRLIDAWQQRIPVWPVLSRMAEAAADIYELEQLTNPIAPVAPSDPIALGRYADELNLHMRKIVDAPKTLAVLTDALTQSLAALRDRLPETALQSRRSFHDTIDAPPPPLTVPLIDALPDIPQAVYDVAIAFYTDEIRDLGLFRHLKAQLDENDRAVSASGTTYLPPWEYKAPIRDTIAAYLRDTPLRSLFDCELPFVLPDEARFAGHWILSPPGRGKTTLLHAMVMEDIEKPDACLILMDSKGDFIDPIRRLGSIQDRLIVIDPDPQNPVAINPLDIGQANIAQSVDLLEYLFASLLEFKMTAMQTTLFRSVLRALVVGFPNPTLETFRDLLANGYEKYAVHIEKLPSDLREFFHRDFNERNYVDRRREVLQRLRLLLDNDTMRAMLTAATTRFRIGEAMDNGKIVVINNSKARLGDQGAEFFGRFFIAQVLAAAQQRSARRADQKPPVYFYIDECQNVIARDEKIPTILDECRSQNIALIMAHQRTKQISAENVLDALSNCAIRFANSDEEARYLAPRLRTSPEFLQSLGRGKFAAYVRDVTREAAAVSVNRVDFADHRAISATEAHLAQERMRRDYGVPLQIGAPAPDEPAPEVRPAGADTSRPAPTGSDVPRPAATAPHAAGRDQAAKDWQ